MCQRCCLIHIQNHLQVNDYDGHCVARNYCINCYCRFGCPKRLISDQGREFINNVNAELQALLGTEHRMTSAYHPQSNGLVEKFNHTIQNCLLKMVNDHQNDWDDYLDPILFAIRTSKQKSTGYTPFEMMFKR